jgi:hypothetical protein
MSRTLYLSLLLLLALTAVTGCLETGDGSSPDERTSADTAPSAGALEKEVQVPPELTLAHSNCGHMVWCHEPSDGAALYCFFSQTTTGCTLSDISSDVNSDCQAICGHTACLELHVFACASGCNGQC